MGEENGKLRKSGRWERQTCGRRHPHVNAVATVSYDARVIRPQTGYSRTETEPLWSCKWIPVGASLLAIAVDQSMLMLDDLTLSRASSHILFGGVTGNSDDAFLGELLLINHQEKS